MNIVVWYIGRRGDRIEIPCDNMREAQREAEKMMNAGIVPHIEETDYIPQDIVAKICEQ